MSERSLRTSHLPSKPNPQSGKPRPPRAPVQDDWRPQGRPDLEDANLPKIPAGVAPMLEWHTPDRRFKRRGALFIAVIVAAYGTFQYQGFEWVAYWESWAVMLGGAAAMYYTLGHEGRTCAGADWFRGTRGFVKTYDLVEVKIRRSIGWDVMLKDSHGGKTVTPLDVLQQNRDLWDLVYNGIRHSVANGAKVNDRARDWLEL